MGQRFRTLADGAATKIAVLAIGYAKSTDAHADVKRTAAALQPGTSATVGRHVIDGRTATFGTGTNGSLDARRLVIDSFADGETLAP
ncbi:MAG: hypothetical protein WCK58_07870 [Chloroflexota bacterium]